MTPKQELFVAEYLVDFNATQAAIRAGYSEKTAYSQGQRLLKDVDVAAKLSASHAKRIENANISAERVLKEMARIGFSTPRQAVRWGMRAQAGEEDEAGSEPSGSAPYVEFINSDDLDEDTAAAISEVSMSATGGLKVKFHDKGAALVNLGKHLGLFSDKLEITTPIRFIIDGAPEATK